MGTWVLAGQLVAKKAHETFTNGPFSNHFFTYYASGAQLWHWIAIALAAAGGSGACVDGDRVCQVTTQLLIFAGSPQKALPGGVETAFQLLMAVWILSIASIVCFELVRGKFGATRQLRDPQRLTGLSPLGLLLYLLLVLQAFTVRSLSLPISMLSFPDVAGEAPVLVSVIMLLGTLLSLLAVAVFLFLSEGFSASPGIGVRVSSTVMLTTFGVDFVLGLVLPYLLLPLFPGERSPVTSAVICLSVAGLNYLAWRTADQARAAGLASTRGSLAAALSVCISAPLLAGIGTRFGESGQLSSGQLVIISCLAAFTFSFSNFASLERDRLAFSKGYKASTSAAQALRWASLVLRPTDLASSKKRMNNLRLILLCTLDSNVQSHTAAAHHKHPSSFSSVDVPYGALAAYLSYNCLSWATKRWPNDAGLRCALGAVSMRHAQLAAAAKTAAGTSGKVLWHGIRLDLAQRGVCTAVLAHLHVAHRKSQWFQLGTRASIFASATRARALLDKQYSEAASGLGSGGGNEGGDDDSATHDASTVSGSTMITDDSGGFVAARAHDALLPPSHAHRHKEALRAAQAAEAVALQAVTSAWSHFTGTAVDVLSILPVSKHHLMHMQRAHIKYAEAVRTNPRSIAACRAYAGFLEGVAGLQDVGRHFHARADALATEASKAETRGAVLDMGGFRLGRSLGAVGEVSDGDSGDVGELLVSGLREGDHVVLQASTSAARLLGRHPADLVGSSVGSLLPPAMSGAFVSSLGWALEGITDRSSEGDARGGHDSAGGVRVRLGVWQVWLAWNASRGVCQPIMLGICETFASARGSSLRQLVQPQLRVLVRAVDVTCAVFLLGLGKGKSTGRVSWSELGSGELLGCDSAAVGTVYGGSGSRTRQTVIRAKDVFTVPPDAASTLVGGNRTKECDVTINQLDGRVTTRARAVAHVCNLSAGQRSLLRFMVVCAELQEPDHGARRFPTGTQSADLAPPLGNAPNRMQTLAAEPHAASLDRGSAAGTTFGSANELEHGAAFQGHFGHSLRHHGSFKDAAGTTDSGRSDADSTTMHAVVSLPGAPGAPARISAPSTHRELPARAATDHSNPLAEPSFPRQTSDLLTSTKEYSSLNSAAELLRHSAIGLGVNSRATRAAAAWGNLQPHTSQRYEDPSVKVITRCLVFMTVTVIGILTAVLVAVYPDSRAALEGISRGTIQSASRYRVALSIHAAVHVALNETGLYSEAKIDSHSELRLLQDDLDNLRDELRDLNLQTDDLHIQAARSFGGSVQSFSYVFANASDSRLWSDFNANVDGLHVWLDRVRWVPVQDSNALPRIMSIDECVDWVLQNVRVITALPPADLLAEVETLRALEVNLHRSILPALNASVYTHGRTLGHFQNVVALTNSPAFTAGAAALAFIIIATIGVVLVGLAWRIVNPVAVAASSSQQQIRKVITAASIRRDALSGDSGAGAAASRSSLDAVAEWNSHGERASGLHVIDDIAKPRREVLSGAGRDASTLAASNRGLAELRSRGRSASSDTSARAGSGADHNSKPSAFGNRTKAFYRVWVILSCFTTVPFVGVVVSMLTAFPNRNTTTIAEPMSRAGYIVELSTAISAFNKGVESAASAIALCSTANGSSCSLDVSASTRDELLSIEQHALSIMAQYTNGQDATETSMLTNQDIPPLESGSVQLQLLSRNGCLSSFGLDGTRWQDQDCTSLASGVLAQGGVQQATLQLFSRGSRLLSSAASSPVSAVREELAALVQLEKRLIRDTLRYLLSFQASHNSERGGEWLAALQTVGIALYVVWPLMLLPQLVGLRMAQELVVQLRCIMSHASLEDLPLDAATALKAAVLHHGRHSRRAGQ